VRRIAWLGIFVVLVVGLTAGCGGDDDETTTVATETVVTTETETTEAETETETFSDLTAGSVTSLEVGELECVEGELDGTVTVDWETDGATAVELTVDGQTVADQGPSGSADISVPCDGATHDVGVTPLSDAGAGESQTQQVGPG
jgi:hypothetical protein